MINTYIPHFLFYYIFIILYYLLSVLSVNSKYRGLAGPSGGRGWRTGCRLFDAISGCDGHSGTTSPVPCK